MSGEEEEEEEWGRKKWGLPPTCVRVGEKEKWRKAGEANGKKIQKKKTRKKKRKRGDGVSLGRGYMGKGIEGRWRREEREKK